MRTEFDGVRIHPKLDEAQISDGTLQQLLREFIEQRTGRKVYGSVQIITTEMQELGSRRDGHYTAQADLYPVE